MCVRVRHAYHAPEAGYEPQHLDLRLVPHRATPHALVLLWVLRRQGNGEHANENMLDQRGLVQARVPDLPLLVPAWVRYSV
jgi:hypothetical protein